MMNRLVSDPRGIVPKKSGTNHVDRYLLAIVPRLYTNTPCPYKQATTTARACKSWYNARQDLHLALIDLDMLLPPKGQEGGGQGDGGCSRLLVVILVQDRGGRRGRRYTFTRFWGWGGSSPVQTAEMFGKYKGHVPPPCGSPSLNQQTPRSFP